MQAVFTGFDSAWGIAKPGALCNLLLLDDSLRLASEPTQTDWASALNRARQKLDVDLQVWAIDQPLLVSNANSCRPVERDLARALMGDFGCGAHSSNRKMAAFGEDAPVWALLRVLQEEGYIHNPMAIPSATAGRFYFECFPHPAIIGLFDLNRILQYKVDHRNQTDWQRLVRLVRSLVSAELPIRNIENFVPENLPQNKRNEDNLDSIISGYTAAYWWKFGVQRSTVVGDLSTGYMVTPHSRRTLAALTRVFAQRVNLRGTVATVTTPDRPHEEERPVPDNAAGKPAAASDLPRSDWVYFATPSVGQGANALRDLVRKAGMIFCHLYFDKDDVYQRLPHVKDLQQGDRLVLVYGAGREYSVVLGCVIHNADRSVLNQQNGQMFDVFSYVDDPSVCELLTSQGYTPDPRLGRFTGISVEVLADVPDIPGPISRPRPGDRRTIWRWDEVFPELAPPTCARA
jgi:predicted RNase H-like nuclease